MKRKIIFGVEEGLIGILLMAWIVLTTAFFGPQLINGFHADLSAELESTKKISDIPGLSTISQLGWVLIFISTGLLIIYLCCWAAMSFFGVRKRTILYLNVTCFIVIAIVLVLGILFETLNL